jgi:hypothetical protein
MVAAAIKEDQASGASERTFSATIGCGACCPYTQATNRSCTERLSPWKSIVCTMPDSLPDVRAGAASRRAT